MNTFSLFHLPAHISIFDHLHQISHLHLAVFWFPIKETLMLALPPLLTSSIFFLFSCLSAVPLDKSAARLRSKNSVCSIAAATAPPFLLPYIEGQWVCVKSLCAHYLSRSQKEMWLEPFWKIKLEIKVLCSCWFVGSVCREHIGTSKNGTDVFICWEIANTNDS